MLESSIFAFQPLLSGVVELTVAAQVDSILTFKFIRPEINHTLVKIIATQEGITLVACT
jgi:hypothetical protein